MRLYWKITKFIIRIIAINLNFKVSPYKLFLVVTKKCQSRCKNCFIWDSHIENELTLQDYEKLAISFNSNLFWLNISGGEPTDHHDLIAVINIFKKHCPNLTFINFTSNALNQDKLDHLIRILDDDKSFIIGINISLDGQEEMHDFLRGIKGNYNLAINSIRKLSLTKNIHWKASMTLFSENHNSIEETYQGIKEHIPNFKLKNFHLNYSFYSNHYYKNKSAKNNSSKITTNIPKNFQQKPYTLTGIVENIYLKKLKNFTESQYTPVSCSALKHNIHIDEQGNLYPCTIWDKKLGNIKDYQYNIDQLLSTEKVITTINEIKAKKCPNCWSPCEAYPSIINHLSESIW